MRRPLAGLLYVFLGLPIALSGLLALSVRPWILDRSFYHRAIDDPRLWTALRSPEALKGVPERVEIGGYIFSGPALYGALQKHIPETALKSVANKAVDDVISAVSSGQNVPPMDLRPFKADLARNAAAIAADYVASLPEGSSGGTPTDLTSRLPGSQRKELDTADSSIGALVASIPDEARPEMRAEAGVVRGPTVTGVSSLERSASSAVGAGIALLLGLGFLGGGGIGRSLSRAGRFLILPSAIVLGAGIALSIPGAPIAMQIASHATGGADAGFFRALSGWLGSWLGVAARSFFVVGLSGVSIGALFASLRRIFEPREI